MMNVPQFISFVSILIGSVIIGMQYGIVTGIGIFFIAFGTMPIRKMWLLWNLTVKNLKK